MTEVFVIISIVLTICAILYSGTLLWVNVFAKCITDVENKNKGMLKGIQNSMIFSMVGIFASCVFAKRPDFEYSLNSAAGYYRGFAIVWFVILILAMLVHLHTYANKKALRAENKKAITKLYTICIWGIIISVLLTSLFF